LGFRFERIFPFKTVFLGFRFGSAFFGQKLPRNHREIWSGILKNMLIQSLTLTFAQHRSRGKTNRNFGDLRYENYPMDPIQSFQDLSLELTV
jgi:hypothetical protein